VRPNSFGFRAVVRVRPVSLLFARALIASCALSACHAPPRADVSPERDIAAQAGLASLEFRVAGPDGGPVDEPELAPDALTYADAVRRAVTTDPGLQSALARVRIAAADADQARLLPNPVLDVVLRWGGGKPEIEASFAQPFVEALQLPERASAADNRLRRVAAEAVVTALDVIGEVQERYIAAQSSAALRPLLEERRGLVEQLVSTARARLEAGEGTRADVVTLDAQRVELQVSIDRARISERSSRLSLARLIGQPSSAAAWTLDSWSAPTVGTRSEAAWVEAALRARPEIQAVAWHLKVLGDERALAHLWPWEGASAGLDAQRDDGWSFGPALSTPLPLFDAGDARQARLFAEQLEVRHELTLARRKVIEEVRTAYETLVAAGVNSARIQGELIPLQRQRRQLAEDAYRAGQTDVTPLFLAEQELRLAETQAIEVEAQAAVALVRLQRAVGGPGVAAGLADAQFPSPDAERARLAALRSEPSPARQP
jgi:cobalt-zinc-cadmium efflux system outer membrane protein